MLSVLSLTNAVRLLFIKVFHPYLTLPGFYGYLTGKYLTFVWAKRIRTYVNGSLVDWKSGTINCQIIKQVTETCKYTPVPSRFAAAGNYRPRFKTTENMYYYFDCHKGDNWPTHDPCGRNQGNHGKHVVNPHGNIFIPKHNSYVLDRRFLNHK